MIQQCRWYTCDNTHDTMSHIHDSKETKGCMEASGGRRGSSNRGWERECPETLAGADTHIDT